MFKTLLPFFNDYFKQLQNKNTTPCYHLLTHPDRNVFIQQEKNFSEGEWNV